MAMARKWYPITDYVSAVWTSAALLIAAISNVLDVHTAYYVVCFVIYRFPIVAINVYIEFPKQTIIIAVQISAHYSAYIMSGVLFSV